MAINAIATVGADYGSGHNDPTKYEIAITYYVTNGSTVSGETAHATIAVGTETVKVDRLVREATAADILTKFSFTIDPSDIYFPRP